MDHDSIRKPGKCLEASAGCKQVERLEITPKSHKGTNQTKFSKSNDCDAMEHQTPNDCRGVGGST